MSRALHALVAAVLFLVASSSTLLLNTPLSAQDKAFNPLLVEWEELADGVWAGVRPDPHRHPVLGSTTIVIGTESVLVFDGGGLPGQSDQVITKIRSLTDLPVSHVVISHWHGDHAFGIWRFRETWPDVAYIAHSFTDRAFKSEKIRYIDNYPNYLTETVPEFQSILDAAKSGERPMQDHDRLEYERIVAAAELVAPEFKAARLPVPTLVIDGNMTVRLGGRQVELLHLGHGNTEGDLILWLPESKIAAAGDLVVHPSPYAFNMPPRAFAATLTALNALEYEVLVPGHGAVQRDTQYVDLLIEVSTRLADQRDQLVAEGVPVDELAKKLSLFSYEKVFIGEFPGYEGFFEGYFARPFVAAAVKELSGEPMVELVPLDGKD